MGTLITAKNLHYTQAITLMPSEKMALQIAKRALGEAPQTRGLFDPALLGRDTGFRSLGEYALNLISAPISGSGAPDMFIHGLIIKTPGSLQHTLPNEISYLEPLIWMCANHELACDPDMTDKLGFLTVRSLLLKADEKQIAEGGWHTRKPPSREGILKRMLACKINASSLHWASKIDPNAIQSEYLVSDMVGTLIQEKPARTMPVITEGDLSYNIPEPSFAFRRAADYEVLHGNSYTFHAAATPKPKDIGKKRTFVLLTYVPTLG